MNKKGVSRTCMVSCICFLVIIEIFTVFLMYKSFTNKDADLTSVKLTEKSVDNNMLAVLLQQEDGTYEASDKDFWSITGYAYNESMSGCMDMKGEKLDDALEYDVANEKVTINTDKTAYCYLYFDLLSDILSSRIIQSAGNGQIFHETITDSEGNLVDAGYRYEGLEVNNYVAFNDETWRIIGVEEGSNIGLENGKYYTKIIRNEAFESLPYQEENTGRELISSMLNGPYYNRTSETFEVGDFTVDFTTTGLTTDAKKLIVDANWYEISYVDITTPLNTYMAEKSKVGNQAYIGLMSPSDYGLSALQSECKDVSLKSFTSCNSWLYNNIDEWVLSNILTCNQEEYNCDKAELTDYVSLYLESTTKSIDWKDPAVAVSTRPVVYLDPNIIITNDGTGEESNKFEIALP